jgi:hypothetical protein
LFDETATKKMSHSLGGRPVIRFLPAAPISSLILTHGERLISSAIGITPMPYHMVVVVSSGGIGSE